jgi:hypothetical protein
LVDWLLPPNRCCVRSNTVESTTVRHFEVISEPSPIIQIQTTFYSHFNFKERVRVITNKCHSRIKYSYFLYQNTKIFRLSQVFTFHYRFGLRLNSIWYWIRLDSTVRDPNMSLIGGRLSFNHVICWKSIKWKQFRKKCFRSFLAKYPDFFWEKTFRSFSVKKIWFFFRKKCFDFR